MRPSIDRSRFASGFTLVELLVSIVIAAAVTVGLTTLLNSDLRANATVQRFQRLRRQASHARRFIELEASTASRLERLSANSLRFAGVHANGSNYTITYEIIAASDVSQAGVAFRGPFVLRRTGPPYTAQGILATTANQDSVILDGLEGLEAFTVQSQQGTSRGALVRIDLNDADSDFNPEFALAVATSPTLNLLQIPKENVTANCSGTPAPAGCRNDGTTQEWDTRSSGTTITPVGTPEQVIVYFDALKPTAANAIRRSASTSPVETCNRSSCYVFVTGQGYTINTRVDKLVFIDEVVSVPPI
jgi:prepilin-type N-terminal cleavage/methylation domain-containing protein